MIAALYVQTGGVYFGLDGVEPWDEQRDARLYAGPWPVVVHPPCARWCRLAKLVESLGGAAVGDDGGTFAAALASVRAWGGVLEHPAWSMAWAVHGLIRPPAFGWARTTDGSWVCEVAQAAYGHRAPKLTWLYYVGDPPPPPLDWSRPACAKTATPRPKAKRRGAPVEALGHAERSRTPIPFRDLLLSIASRARPARAA